MSLPASSPAAFARRDAGWGGAAAVAAKPAAPRAFAVAALVGDDSRPGVPAMIELTTP
ncbi:hypothetical protein [Lysobacter sp. yr284]|uniref:hypothetical protein n=1 Tax=Lysobacter sp. yr284 TaxID=1761791 RepID=UPI001587566E|nr:hypothetical protein [Lysobacter sp. yr284]